MKSYEDLNPPSTASNVGAYSVVGLIVAALLLGQCGRQMSKEVEASKPAPVATAPKAEPVPPLALTMAAQLATAKRHRVLYESRDGRVQLTNVDASHPWCDINGKPTQVAKVDDTFTCYRWQGDRVMLRLDAKNWLMMRDTDFRSR